MIRTSLLVLALSATTAAADPENRVVISGSDARALTLGMKLAGIPSTKDSSGVRYTVTQVTCTTTDGGVLDDGLDTASCQTAAAKSMGATASALLADGITGALGPKGLPTDTHMSKTTVTVASLVCAIAPDAKAPKSLDRFRCEAGLRTSLLITPKKIKVKDIVQPVKIDKQELQPE